ncbi:hypothetical protein TI39_contig305g00013 [Zymoseptoria brevis]|uniref:Autophagy-related protein 14 n=1 Tax=Zymoseptoria brevis TaxID=1047168 RepID=A0A0F4GXX8_9PEZI|nr:hypothetical protein TI39_contig305g00013 [Zymoseptoria brevis]
MDVTTPRCDICSRTFNSRRKPQCASCAQTLLYSPRLEQATALLDREKSHSHAEAVIRPGNDGVLAALSEDADLDSLTTSISTNSLERRREEQEATEHRVERILAKAEELKRQIDAHRERSVAQKEELEHRRSVLAEDRVELEKHRPRAMEPVITTRKKTAQRLEKVRARIVEARLLLCREAASASNLQRRKPSVGRSEYMLGGIAIPDLRELNVKTQAPSKQTSTGGRVVAEPHDLVSEAFANVARLLNLCAHYLSVRLPGEILLPHEDFPRPAIMLEKASYQFKDLAYPSLSSSRTMSPAASRTLDEQRPRPRPLWIDRPLAQLCKEDNKAYGLYIEAITMIAYDIAWLCRTQGIDTINTFEETCHIGRNLWQLLVHQGRRRPTLDRRISALSGKSAQDSRSTGSLGVFSHATARNNLASPEGAAFMRDFKLSSPGRLADKLKNTLLGEFSGAEWEMLEEKEWDEDREDERPVLVGGSNRPKESQYAAMSVMSITPHEDTTEDEVRRKGNSGWMRVRGRAGDM